MFFMFATSLGNVRRNMISDFKRIPSNGKRAMCLDLGETLVGVGLCTTNDDVMLFTKNGLCTRFFVENVRIFAGRDSNGVRGLRLQSDDSIIAMTIIKHNVVDTDERDIYLREANKMRSLGDNVVEDTNTEEVGGVLSLERFEELQQEEEFILTVTENGFGKRSSAYGYRTTNRGNLGYESIIVNERNGCVVGAFPINSEDQIMLITDKGQIIRTSVNEIRIAGRRTQGVTLFRLHGSEKIVSASRIPLEQISLDDDTASLESGEVESREVESEL